MGRETVAERGPPPQDHGAPTNGAGDHHEGSEAAVASIAGTAGQSVRTQGGTVMTKDPGVSALSRRRLLQAGAVLGAGVAFAGSTRLVSPAFAAGRTLTIADIGVGDPGGDWSRFTKATGYNVNLVPIGNAPSAVLNALVAGGGTATYRRHQHRRRHAKAAGRQRSDRRSTPPSCRTGQRQLHRGVSRQGQARLQLHRLPGQDLRRADRAPGRLVRLSARKDRQARFLRRPVRSEMEGLVALEDNYTTAGQKTALYLKHASWPRSTIPDDMTPEEVKTVIDFLIAKKKAGQFRVIWSSFEQAVNLITSKEVYVIDCWEPMVFVAKAKGLDAVYAAPKEGYLLWAMAAYMVNNPDRSEERPEGGLRAPRFHAGRLVRRQDHALARLHDQPEAPDYAKAHPDEFSAEEAAKVAEITANVQRSSSRAAPGRTAGRPTSTSTRRSGSASSRRDVAGPARFSPGAAPEPGPGLASAGPRPAAPGGRPADPRASLHHARGQLLQREGLLDPARRSPSTPTAFLHRRPPRGARAQLPGGLRVDRAHAADRLSDRLSGSRSRVRPELTRAFLFLFAVPFLVNYIVRTFAWADLLSRTGVVNSLLLGPG